MDTSYLHQLISTVCPIVCVSIGDENDKSTWRIDFDPSATDTQQAAALTVVSGFDPNAPTPPKVSSEEFIGLLTPAEQSALINSTDTSMKLFVLRAMAAGIIDLGNPLVSQGIDAAIALGLIASGRKAQILSGQIPA